MKLIQLFTAILALVGSAAAASIPSVISDQTDGVVKLGLIVNRTRANELPGTILQNITSFYPEDYYYFNLTVGSQEVPIPVFIDTGSGDLVLDSDTYDPSQSTSAKNLNYVFSDWRVNYSMYTDTVSFDTFTLENFKLGVDYKNSFGWNLLGVGPVGEESLAESNEYHNFLMRLKDSNYIKSYGFSIYLESFDPIILHGSILFGGIDHAKYTGELVSFPYTTDPHLPTTIEMSGIRFANGTYIAINDQVAVDSGTPTIALPPEIGSSIQAVFGPVDSKGNVIDFQESWKTTYFSFEFANLNISIPYIDFLYSNDGGYAFHVIYE